MDWENPQILKLIRLVAQSAWRYERDSALLSSRRLASSQQTMR